MIELNLTHIGGALIILGGGLAGLIKGGYLRVGKDNSKAEKHETCSLHTTLEADRKDKWEKLDKTIDKWDEMAQTLLSDAIERKGQVKSHESRIDKLDNTIVSINTSLFNIARDVAVNKAVVDQKENFFNESLKTIFDKLDQLR